MAPWEAVTPDSVPAPAERALSFISKSLSEVQRSAESDMKLIASRVQSFKNLPTALDREWESLKSSSLSSNFVRNDSRKYEEFDFLKSLKPNLDNLSNFRRSFSDPDFRDRPSITALVPKVNKKLGFGREGWEPSQRQRDRKVVVNWQGSRKKKVRVSKEWEPLKRMKESVEESLRDLEVIAATRKRPVDFLENVQKAEFFENVKRNLKLATSPNTNPTTDELGKDVAPLDVPELLESLVRQTEPLLDHLGFKKDVSEKVCEMLRSCKRKDLQLSTTAAVSRKDSAVSKRDSSKEDDLDLRIASVVQSTGYNYKGGLWSENESLKQASEDLRRNVAIVTTASLPWMTGTAVNPLFRAAYLAKSGEQKVTLLVPWLCKKDQEQVYPNRMTFESPAEQESFVRNWVEDRVGFKSNFKIAFYPGKFSTEKRSILAAGDISQFIPDQEADVAVLEEPEHLTWYYHGRRWTDKFQYVVGVVHTNYLEYVKREKNGKLQSFFLKHVNNWMVRIYCNKVLRLSAATQNLPKSSVCNVHGVNPQFLKIGKRMAEEKYSGPKFSEGAYYLGKMIWGKGYRELVDLLAQNQDVLGNMNMDVFGSGEDSEAVKAEAQKHGLAMNFHKGIDHADPSLHRYKVFINPSISDVVCTTTAEALAMGKIVVCADHPSNEFFLSFPNCLTYRSPEEFVERVKQAISSEPVPLSPDLQHLLSWEAATDRFVDSADLMRLPTRGARTKRTKTKLLPGEAARRRTMTLSLAVPKKKLNNIVDKGLAFAHYFLSGIESFRLAGGALPGTMHINEELCKDLGIPYPPPQRPLLGAVETDVHGRSVPLISIL